MGPLRFQRRNGLAVTPLTGFWALGSLEGTLDPTIPNLPLVEAAGGAVTGTAVSTVSGGAAVASGVERFSGAASSVSAGLAIAGGSVAEDVTGVAVSVVSGVTASGNGVVAGAPVSHFYQGGGWGYFKRRREDDEPALEEAYTEIVAHARANATPMGDVLIQALAPYADQATSAPAAPQIDWAAIRRAGEERAIWAAIEAEIAARRAWEDDEDETITLLLMAA